MENSEIFFQFNKNADIFLGYEKKTKIKRSDIRKMIKKCRKIVDLCNEYINYYIQARRKINLIIDNLEKMLENKED